MPGETSSIPTCKKESSNLDDADPLGSVVKEFKINVKSNYQPNVNSNDETIAIFKKRFYPNISPSEWNNWQWQIKNSITDYSKLEELFDVKLDAKSLIEKKLPFRITPYYASVVYNSHELRKTVIPTYNELLISEGEELDPLDEEEDSPVSGLVHRYPDRVLFLVTSFCSTNCRYCTRSRIISKESNKNKTNWKMAIDYIKNHNEIRDVLISGGDPLTLSDSTLDFLLHEIRTIKHVEIIRIGTKVPVVLPMRVTKNLLNILKKYHPLYMSIHFTHPDEISSDVKKACNNLADAGIPLGSQTVLLKDINNNPIVMKKLFHELLKIRVKPYYLYQCDPIIGSAHFRTEVEEGLNIIESLRGWTSGYAIPHYVIDAPGGGGKIPLTPQYFLGKDEKGNILIRNYENNIYTYPAIK